MINLTNLEAVILAIQIFSAGMFFTFVGFEFFKNINTTIARLICLVVFWCCYIVLLFG